MDPVWPHTVWNIGFLYHPPSVMTERTKHMKHKKSLCHTKIRSHLKYLHVQFLGNCYKVRGAECHAIVIHLQEMVNNSYHKACNHRHTENSLESSPFHHLGRMFATFPPKICYFWTQVCYPGCKFGYCALQFHPGKNSSSLTGNW